MSKMNIDLIYGYIALFIVMLGLGIGLMVYSWGTAIAFIIGGILAGSGVIALLITFVEGLMRGAPESQ